MQMIDLLDIVLSPSIRIPSYDERLKESIHFYGYQIAIAIDGSEQEVVNPLDKEIENGVFSGKYLSHTFTLLIGCSPTSGYIYFLGPSYCGSLNDKNLYNIPENWVHSQLREHETIIADKGFRGNQLN